MTSPSGSILVSSARSGTNYFLDVYKECFPSDFVVKEIFRDGGDSLKLIASLLDISTEAVVDKLEANPRAFWMRIEKQCADQGIRALAKIFYYHQSPEAALWSYFKNHDRVVHLIRRNPFDSFLSLKVATQTGQWQNRGKEQSAQDVTVTLDPAELGAFIDRQKGFVEWTRRKFANAIDYRELFYEDIADSMDSCVAFIRDTFGPLEGPTPTSVGIKRQKTTTNDEIVANYAAVQHLDMRIF